jgi:hypothetical protein
MTLACQETTALSVSAPTNTSPMLCTPVKKDGYGGGSLVMDGRQMQVWPPRKGACYLGSLRP